jgi:lambda repressor-like predicted transcriptional regulator
MEAPATTAPSTPSATPRRPWLELRWLLGKRGLTVPAFSRLSGISLDTLRFYIYGRRHPQRRLIARVAAALSVDPIVLTPPPAPPKTTRTRTRTEAPNQ